MNGTRNGMSEISASVRQQTLSSNDITKVSSLHLRNIEDENFGELPADVYVRGFVTAFAKTIGLDPQFVVPSYMTRLQESRQKNQKSRFLGLR